MKKRYSDSLVPGWVVMLRENLSSSEKDALQGKSAHDSFTVATLLRDRVNQELTEVMWVIGINGRNKIHFCQEVARGGRSSLTVTPADIYRVAAATSAHAIILAHNHPSGDPSPSSEDIYMTKMMQEGGKTLGIPLLDHIIMSPDVSRYSSLLELGLMNL